MNECMWKTMSTTVRLELFLTTCDFGYLKIYVEQREAENFSKMHYLCV